MLRTFFFAAAAGALFAAFAGAFAPAAAAAQTPRPVLGPLDRAEFVRGLRDSPGGVVIAAIERNYPLEAPRLIDRMFERAAASSGRTDELAAIGAAITDEFLRSKAPDLINAPAAALLRFNADQLALFRALAERHPHLCMRAFLGQMNDPLAIPRDVMPLMRNISISFIDAAGAGHRGPRIAGRGELRPQHRDLWVGRMQALDRDGEVLALLADPARMEAAPPQLQCQLAITTHEAISRMPPEAAASLLAFFVAETFRQRAAQAV